MAAVMRRTWRFLPSTSSSPIQQSGTLLRKRIGGSRGGSFGVAASRQSAADCFCGRNGGALPRRRYGREDYFRLRLQNPRAARQGFPALNRNAAFQFFQTFRRRNFFHLRPILALVRVARMQQAFVPLRFVAQQQQALGIRVEPANGINIFRETEFRQRAVGRPSACRATARRVGA